MFVIYTIGYQNKLKLKLSFGELSVHMCVLCLRLFVNASEYSATL